jgi:transcriptional regulator with XRE-family HTH domain
MGRRLRVAREARGLSLREVARRINVSPSFVSQVERGKANPSVGTLYALVSELGASLDELMGEDPDVAAEVETPPDGAVAVVHAIAEATSARGDTSPERMAWDPQTATWPRIGVPVQRAHGRRRIQLSGVVWERLTYDDDPFVDFLQVTYGPGSSSCPDTDMMRHGGREYGHLTTGRLDVQIGFDVHHLSPGDSIHFDSTTPHRLYNPHDEPATALWVVVGRREDNRVPEPPHPGTSHLPGLL